MMKYINDEKLFSDQLVVTSRKKQWIIIFTVWINTNIDFILF